MAATKDEDEFYRLTKQLLKDTGTRLFAANADWERPISLEAMIFASLYTTWSGERHPFMPDIQDRTLSDVDIRLADKALENMNRR